MGSRQRGTLYRLVVTADEASSFPQAHQAPTVRVGLLGCGNVGGALAEILLTRSEDVAARTGIRLELVGIAVAHRRAGGGRGRLRAGGVCLGGHLQTVQAAAR